VHDKSEVQEKVKTFIRRAQKEFGLPIKKVWSDNGTKFFNTNVEMFLDDEGMKHEFSAPYTPQQNGVVEEESHSHWHGKNNAWWVQDSEQQLGRSNQHHLSCYQPPLSSQVL
jgi:transposase InsO family protein